MSLSLQPISIADAKAIVAKWHRHNKPPVSGLFGIAAVAAGDIVGIIIAGSPVARALDDGLTVELTRNATNGHLNACSFLYGAARRAAVSMGFRRVFTYTLALIIIELTSEESDFIWEGCPNFDNRTEGESGASLRAAGFCIDAVLAPRESWSCAARPRVQTDLFGNAQRPPPSEGAMDMAGVGQEGEIMIRASRALIVDRGIRRPVLPFLVACTSGKIAAAPTVNPLAHCDYQPGEGKILNRHPVPAGNGSPNKRKPYIENDGPDPYLMGLSSEQHCVNPFVPGSEDHELWEIGHQEAHECAVRRKGVTC